MTTFGVSMVRDEADVIEGTLRHMAGEVDGLIVADNGSVDGTREILEQLATELPLWVIDDPDPAYYQSAKMTALAERAAHESGAEWIVPFDADELWSGPERLSVVCAAHKEAHVLPATLYNHWASAADPVEDDVFRRFVWRDIQPSGLPKVAFRWRDGTVIEQGNHAVTMPGRVFRVPDILQVRHFPYRSAEQFIRKALNGAAALAVTDLPAASGAHWRQYGQQYDAGEADGRGGDFVLKEIYETYFTKLSPVDEGMVFDPAPYRRWETTEPIIEDT